MKARRNLFIVTISFLTVGMLIGCTKKGTEKESADLGSKVTSKDVISQKDTVVDGQEVTEYTLSDGNTVIALPKGVDIDEAGIEMPTEEQLEKGKIVEESESMETD